MREFGYLLVSLIQPVIWFQEVADVTGRTDRQAKRGVQPEMLCLLELAVRCSWFVWSGHAQSCLHSTMTILAQ